MYMNTIDGMLSDSMNMLTNRTLIYTYLYLFYRFIWWFSSPTSTRSS